MRGVLQSLPCEAPVGQGWPWVDTSRLSAQFEQRRLSLNRPMWEWQSLLQRSHLCVVSGLVDASFLQARCSSAITISFSSPSFSCLWRVFLLLLQSAARVPCLTSPLLWRMKQSEQKPKKHFKYLSMFLKCGSMKRSPESFFILCINVWKSRNNIIRKRRELGYWWLVDLCTSRPFEHICKLCSIFWKWNQTQKILHFILR